MSGNIPPYNPIGTFMQTLEKIGISDFKEFISHESTGETNQVIQFSFPDTEEGARQFKNLAQAVNLGSIFVKTP